MEKLPAFENIGKKPGLQVWRIEEFDLQPVPTQLYGQFFTGDAYIVLYTTSANSYDIHAWLGAQSTPDEKGSAAIYMTQMDNHLKGVPRQYVEHQGNESPQFNAYFRHGLIYKQGGAKSGFKIVVVEHPKRLLQVKGRRFVRATEVKLSYESMNKGDCFILEVEKDIYHWSGSESNPFERLKAAEIAIDIRDLERMGRSELHYTKEGEEPEVFRKVLGPKPDLPPATCDKAADAVNRKKASLHLVSDASGSMVTTLVAECNPFKQSILDEKACYIMDALPIVFVWKGKHANQDERKAARKSAEDFIMEHNYPSNTQILVMPQGGESPQFKQYFPSWLDKDESTGPSKPYTIGSIARVEQVPFDASLLHNNKQMAAHHGMVDDGSGTVQIWRVEGGDKEPVDPKLYGQFYGGDCYLILYTYGSSQHVIYIWQGLKSSQDERGASAILAVAMDNSMCHEAAQQVRVVQGHEPAHLLSIFKEKPLIVHLGGTCRKWGNTEPSSTRLFHIRTNSAGFSYAVEVQPASKGLNTNDVFVLMSQEGSFLWKGKGSKGKEMTAAKYVSNKLGGSFTEILENKEPAAFWAALGGKAGYQTSPMLQNAIRPPRLFACSNKTGRVIAEEVFGEFTQSDLATDDVMILDTWEQIFLWVGKESNEREQLECVKIAKDYLEADPAGRCDIPIATIRQGQEPPSFTGWFHAWDTKMWEKDLFATLRASGKSFS